MRRPNPTTTSSKNSMRRDGPEIGYSSDRSQLPPLPPRVPPNQPAYRFDPRGQMEEGFAAIDRIDDGLASLVLQLISRCLNLTTKGALGVWFVFTFPFRFGCKLAFYLLIRLVARPLDLIQLKVFGRYILGAERFLRGLSSIIKPFWYTIFPFKGVDGSTEPTFTQPSNNPLQQQGNSTQFLQQSYAPDPTYSNDQGGSFPRGFSEYRQPVGHSREQFGDGIHDPDIEDSEPGDDGAEFYSSQRFARDMDSRPEYEPRYPPKRRGRRPEQFESDSQNSFESGSSAKLPRAAANMSAAEVDRAVMLAIEAKQTHNVVEKLFWIAVMLMTIIGIVLVRIDFTRKWGGSKIGNVEPAMGFEGMYGVLVVLTIAFRSDFPFNLGVLMLVVFFAGVVFGTIIARSAFAVRNG